MTLDEIIRKYSGKEVEITVKGTPKKGNLSVIGKINGYETKADSEEGDDVIIIEVPYREFYYEIKVSDIISIELVPSGNYDNVKITHYNDNI